MSAILHSSVRAALTCVVVCGGLLLGVASRAEAQSCSITAHYQGLVSVHLSYTVPSLPFGASNVRLVVRRGGATSDTTLENVTVFGASRLYHDQNGLPMDVQRYAILGTTSDGQGGTMTVEYCSRAVTLSRTVEGTPTADDDVAGEALGISPVIVGILVLNPNITLSFDGSTIDRLTISGEGSAGTILAGSLLMKSGAALTLSDVVVNSMQVADVSPAFIRVKFRGRVDVAGGAPIFRDCQFSSTVSLYGRTGATFADNVFASSLYMGSSAEPGFPPARNRSWYEDEAPNPLVINNSFVGSSALIYPNTTDPGPWVPIQIGSNYYGDVGGAAPGGWGFLERRGADVIPSSDCGGQCALRTVFALAPPLPSGPHRNDPAVFPRFWLRGLVVGQNTLEPAKSGTPGSTAILRQDRETLLSAEIVTSDEVVNKVDVYAKVNGVRVDPTNPLLALRRDSSGFGRAGYARATLTHNFILPPQEGDTAKVELWLDASRVTGYSAPAPAPTRLYEETLTFSKPLARALRVCVRPAQVTKLGTGKVPPTSSIIAWIQRELPTMLPVSSAELDVQSCPGIRYDQSVWFVSSFLFDLANLGNLWAVHERILKRPVPDLTVLVVESGVMGAGVDAASVPLFRDVIIVDEGNPGAIVHEIGHAAGLNTLPLFEQYQTHPPYGAPLENATAFSPEGPATSPFDIGDQRRIFHVVGPLNRTHNPDDPVIDVMGNGLKAQWPSLATAKAIGALIAGKTGVMGAPMVQEGRSSAAPAPGTKRILVTGATEKVTVTGPLGSYGVFRLRPGATRAFDLGSDVDQALPPALESAGDAAAFDALDANSAIVASVAFGVVNTIVEQGTPTRGFWAATFDVPEGAVFYRIRTQGTGDFPIAVYDATLETRLTAPLSGATIGSALRVAWADTWTYRGPTPMPDWVQPLQHQLEYSVDGVTWLPLAGPLTGGEATVGTSLLPGGSTISIRLIVSDGLRRATAQVDNLQVPRRPPGLQIRTPHKLARGTVDTFWLLDALAWDDDRTPVTVTWSSDRDGLLGTGAALAGVRLSAGAHRLTCRVVDGDGQSAEGTVEVVVGALNTLDVSVTADALSVTHADAGPVTPAPTFAIGPQRDYIAALRARAPGAPTQGTLRLFLTPPGGPEYLLAERAATVESFDELLLTEKFRTGADGEYLFRATITGAAPNADLSNDERTWRFVARTSTPGPGDADGDALPDDWETRFGLDPTAPGGISGADGDPDNDGLANLEEYQRGSHPRGFHRRYFAEGATSDFLGTTLAVLNPGDAPAHVLLRFQRTSGSESAATLTVPARTRATVDPGTLSGMSVAEFSTAVESDEMVVVDRTLHWDTTTVYGAHTETAVTAPALTWYLAEGSTVGQFNLFYLLQNPNPSEAEVRVRFLQPSGAPLVQSYRLPANSRTNIWVNQEQFEGLGRALASTDVSAVIDSLNGQPIIVERAMYMDSPGQVFGAGHESAGVTAPATQWFLAEGATGPFFDLFVLIANPSETTAHVEATYLLPDGSVISKGYEVTANSRFNIWVDLEDARLANTAVSTTIRSTNGVPVIVERAQWWPGSGWYEAHNSPGATTTGTRWAVADGEVGGARNIDTYVLVANTSPAAGSVKVTLFFEDGASAERTFTVSGNSRFNVDVRVEFLEALNRRFGAVVESVGGSPVQIVVERAMYWDAPGQFWAAGTNALGTKLP